MIPHKDFTTGLYKPKNDLPVKKQIFNRMDSNSGIMKRPHLFGWYFRLISQYLEKCQKGVRYGLFTRVFPASDSAS